MSFLKKIQTKKVEAADGPEGGLDHGASNPLNWVSTLQSGKSDRERYDDAKKLCEIVKGWEENAHQAHRIFEQMMHNGGMMFEKYSPEILKGHSRQDLEFIIEICERLKSAAPNV